MASNPQPDVPARNEASPDGQVAKGDWVAQSDVGADSGAEGGIPMPFSTTTRAQLGEFSLDGRGAPASSRFALGQVPD